MDGEISWRLFLDETEKEQAGERIGINYYRRNCNRDFEITSSRDQELHVKCRGNAKGFYGRKSCLFLLPVFRVSSESEVLISRA